MLFRSHGHYSIKNNDTEIYCRLKRKQKKHFKKDKKEYDKLSDHIGREADFISIVAWRKQAENVCRFLDKGSLISVDGRIQTGSFDGQDGQRRYTTDVVADQVNFLETRSQSQSRSTSSGNQNNDYYTEPTPSNNVELSNNMFDDFGDSVSLDDNFLD